MFGVEKSKVDYTRSTVGQMRELGRRAFRYFETKSLTLKTAWKS